MRPEVRHTEDFERVRDLPRRRLTEKDAAAWAAELTPHAAVPGSGMALRPWQGYAIAECVENNGGFLGLPVGFGKTPLSYLLPYFMGARNPVLIVPGAQDGGLAAKTRADFASYVGKWRTPSPPPRIVTISQIIENEHLLERIDPDLLIIDEADDLGNRESSMARRIDRLVVKKDEAIAVVVMSGTITRNSIMGYWHLLMWALRDRAPLPLTEGEALMWAAALDNKLFRVRRPAPGPLGPNLKAARAWYRKRLAETPGVILVDGDSCTTPLTVSVRLAKECPDIDRHYRRFLVDGQNPDGIPVSDPLSRWRIDGQLGCGLYQYYEPPPPEGWRTARLQVSRFVRDKIARSTHTSRPMDQERQVLARFPDAPEVVEWREWKPRYDTKKHTKVRWLSTATIETVLEWLAEDARPAIVWCGSVEFAEALAYVSGLSYFGEKGKDQHGRGLHAAPPGRHMIVSWQANKKGFNLQAWTRQGIVMPPQSAKWLEQMFGRSHRALQTEPVDITLFGTSGGTLDGFESAMSEAGFARETVGMTQKLLRAAVTYAEPRITESNEFRWARRGHVDDS